MQQIKISRDALKVELAHSNRLIPVNFEPLRASQNDKLSHMLKTKLLNGNRDIAKSYLKLLVEEIRVTNNVALARGNISAIVRAAELAKKQKWAT